jgi:hypothetical protein
LPLLCGPVSAGDPALSSAALAQLHPEGLLIHQVDYLVSTLAFTSVGISVAELDPGSGAVLTPGSGIRNRFFPDHKPIFLRA